MKIKTTVETNLSYLDILAKLKEDISSDTSIPTADREEAENLTLNLYGLLWKYSY